MVVPGKQGRSLEAEGGGGAPVPAVRRREQPEGTRQLQPSPGRDRWLSGRCGPGAGERGRRSRAASFTSRAGPAPPRPAAREERAALGERERERAGPRSRRRCG